jgi:hypothetical protein
MPNLSSLSRLAALVRDAMAIGAALSLVFSTAAALLWLAFADPLLARLRVLLALDDLARASDVVSLAVEMRRLSGADRVIRTRQARSCVEEPVLVGDPVVLILFLERTEVGASCEVLADDAVFEDRSGIRSGGASLPDRAAAGRLAAAAAEPRAPGRPAARPGAGLGDPEVPLRRRRRLRRDRASGVPAARADRTMTA